MSTKDQTPSADLHVEALRYREGGVDREKARVPVPVLLTTGSWDPGKKGLALRRCVTTTIIRDHPYLLAKKFGPMRYLNCSTGAASHSS